MIRTASAPERVLEAMATLAAAQAIAPEGSIPADPRERIAWAGSGAPFLEAGVAGLRDDVDPLTSEPFTDSEIAWIVHEARRAREDPGLLGRHRISLVQPAARHAAGVHYTSDRVADRVLEIVGFPRRDGATLLDPMCGSGAFLLAALRRLAARRPADTHAALLAPVHGMELDGLAVLLARCGLLLAMRRVRGPLPRGADLPRGLNVCRADALEPGAAMTAAHEVVAGNPPWVSWDRLPEAWRRRTAALWKGYGLFPEENRPRDMQAVLGRGRKDLAMLATYVAAARWLAPGGTLGFVLTRSVIKSVGSGAGFRRFTLPDGTPLGVQDVEELPRGAFPGVGTRAIVMVLRKGEATRFPVRYAAPGRSLVAEPVDPRDSCSAWITAPASRLPALRALLGTSWYRARTGAYTGGANGVYWLRRVDDGAPVDGGVAVTNLADAGKRAVPVMSTRLEPDLLYPLLRAADVDRFHARPSAWILLPQDTRRRQGLDETTMRSRYPRALHYLEGMLPVLGQRRDRGTRALIRCGAPPWSVFSVSEETLAAWKVVWPRIASRVRAAVAGPHDGRPAVPQETCTFIACADQEEAAYLAGLLNSALFHEVASAFADTGGKSFGAPHLLRHIAVPRYAPHDVAHRELARLVMGAHEAGPSAETLDAAAAAVWDQVSSRPAATP